MPSAGESILESSVDDQAAGRLWPWVHIMVAAAAMVATLPGRTHGLGLFTEPILASTGIGRDTFGLLNLAATLVGSLFCLPCGWLVDRMGTRRSLVAVQLALAATVIGMGCWTGLTGWALTPLSVLLFITLTRGFGQSALSTASLSLAGRSSLGQPDLMMGVFAALVSLGFVMAFGVLSVVLSDSAVRWQTSWTLIGLAVWGIAVATGFLVQDDRLVTAKTVAATPLDGDDDSAMTLTAAIKTPVFWIFAVGSAFYALVAAGLTLFNQSLLQDLGFEVSVFFNATILGIPVGLAANLVGGWLSMRVPIERVFSAALWLLAASLACLPWVQSEAQIYVYSAAIAASGGVITVAYFSIWRRQFGTTDLGKIQGAAQMMTVVFSAAGPAIFGLVRENSGSYLPLFPVLAAIAATLAGLAIVTPTGRQTR